MSPLQIIFTEKKLFSTRKVTFSISNFRRVVNVPFFLMGDSPKSEFYVPTFLNTLSVPSSLVFRNLGTENPEAGGSPETKKYIKCCLT